MLTAEDQQRWERYLDLERTSQRRPALALLSDLLVSVQHYPEEQQTRWLSSLCERIVDQGEKLPLRNPLMAGWVAPFLLQGLQREQAPAARWMAALHHHITSKSDLWRDLEPWMRDPISLLEHALRWAPEDERARAALVKHLASWFDYTLHELPAGVLFSMDGASLEECQILLENLAQFEAHIGALGHSKQEAPRIARWRRHFTSYADYLRLRPKYRSYEAYLEANFPDWRVPGT